MKKVTDNTKGKGFMTKEELKQAYYLNKEIMKSTEELVELKIESRANVQFRGNPEIKQIILDRESELVEKIRRCKKNRSKIKKFISGIDDSLVRQILYYRYEKCMSWRQVAFMIGGPNTEQSVRKVADRFLSKN